MGDDEVPPIEEPAHVDVGVEDGYVRIDQQLGNQPLYTPSEAREIAADIREAADRAQDAE